MPRRHLAVRLQDEPAGRELRAGFARIRAELKLPPDFPADVLAEAEEAAKSPDLPADDLTDLRFLTIDPPGSTDLDQAMHLERRGAGFRVRYAIADVAAFVRPGGAVDLETHRRGAGPGSPPPPPPPPPPGAPPGGGAAPPGPGR